MSAPEPHERVLLTTVSEIVSGVGGAVDGLSSELPQTLIMPPLRPILPSLLPLGPIPGGPILPAVPILLYSLECLYRSQYWFNYLLLPKLRTPFPFMSAAPLLSTPAQILHSVGLVSLQRHSRAAVSSQL